MNFKRNTYSVDNSTAQSEEQDVGRHSRLQRYVFLAIGAVLVLGSVVIAGAVIGSAGLGRDDEGSQSAARRSGSQSSDGLPPSDSGARQPFSLSEVLGYVYSPALFSPTWVSDSELMHVSDDGVYISNVDTNIRTSLVPGKEWKSLRRPADPILSSSRNYVLIKYDARKVFRYSSQSKYSVYDINKSMLIPISVNSSSSSSSADDQVLQYVAWVPQRDALLIVYRNNVYLRPSIAAPDTLQLTSSGIVDLVYNGIPDWVYEEEVIGSDNVVWLSGDGRSLAFATFNDTMVDVMPISLYGRPGSLHTQYPLSHPLRYPKAGRANPTVTVSVVDLRPLPSGNLTVTVLSPPAELASRDHILARAGWRDGKSLTVTWMSRVQDRVIVSLYTFDDQYGVQQTTLLDMPSPDGSWIDIESQPPLWLPRHTHWLAVLPRLESPALGHFRHVHAISGDGSQQRRALTSGQLTVTELLHHDPTRDLVYFVAAPADNAHERHLYVVSVTTDAAKSPGAHQCITCNTSVGTAEPCEQNSFVFSPDGGHFVWTCQGPATVPRVALHRTDATLKRLRVLEDNQPLRTALQSKAPRRMRSLSVPIDDGFTANVRLLLPPALNENSKDTKYPLLVFTYGGPNSQVVSGRFSIGWADHLATERNIVYATIDGRGSGFRGERLLHAVHRRLGQHEVQDQINVTRKLQQMLPYIDANRTAIWGWSYGGFVSAMALAQDTSNVFRCGISVAPVTNWIYYDTIYTERYMGLPTVDDNLEGYRQSDISSRVGNFVNKQFLLIHGTADDNVHYQQSLLLSRALQLADILFSQQTYTDEEHSLSFVRAHHYHTMERFVESCFDLPQLHFHRASHLAGFGL